MLVALALGCGWLLSSLPAASGFVNGRSPPARTATCAPPPTSPRSEALATDAAAPRRLGFERLRKRRTSRTYRRGDDLGTAVPRDALLTSTVAPTTAPAAAGEEEAGGGASREGAKRKTAPVAVATAAELRSAVLDRRLALSDTTIVARRTTKVAADAEASPLADHAVRSLIRERYLGKSTPGHRRAGDNATLAIAIEGGGMRGWCVRTSHTALFLS